MSLRRLALGAATLAMMAGVALFLEFDQLLQGWLLTGDGSSAQEQRMRAVEERLRLTEMEVEALKAEVQEQIALAGKLQSQVMAQAQSNSPVQPSIPPGLSTKEVAAAAPAPAAAPVPSGVVSPELAKQLESKYGKAPSCFKKTAPADTVDAALFVRLMSQNINHNVIRWIQWAWWSGAETIYLYDTAYAPGDRKLITLPGMPELVDAGLVKYIMRPTPQFTMPKQAAIWADSSKCFPSDGWRWYLDFDEFIFSPEDTKKDWLRRYVKTVPQDTSVLRLCNFIFGGPYLDPETKEKVPDDIGLKQSRPETYTWRTTAAKAENDPRTKVLGRPSKIAHLDIHTANPESGYRSTWGNCSRIRFNHYWGGRVNQMNGFLKDATLHDMLTEVREAFHKKFGVY